VRLVQTDMVVLDSGLGTFSPSLSLSLSLVLTAAQT
jgi:hypothetical protein